MVKIDNSQQPSAIIFPERYNVATSFIDRHIEEGRAEHIAILTYNGEKISYGQLLEQVNRCGNALKALGLEPGARILMSVRDCPMFFNVFWGAIKAGMIPIAVNTLLKAEEYRYLLDDSGCDAYIYSHQLADQATDALASSSNKPKVALATEGQGALAELMASESNQLEAHPVTEDTECFWLYSSGSTGNPKGVVHVHRDMVVTSERYGQGIAHIQEDDLVYSSSKLFFSYGFGGGMTFPLWAGATLLLCDERMSTDLVFEIIESFKPTIYFGVPTLYGQLLHQSEGRNPDLGSIRRALSAGEALPEQVFSSFRERFGVSILDGIGSTEVLHIFISNRQDDIKPGTSGRPVPGYEAKVVDDEGEELPTGEIGTLWVKGGSNAKCYWNNPEKTADTMRGEWLNTGDMYFVDEQGCFVNAGRSDDMLKVGGMWCSPIEIEGCLLKHPMVNEAAVVGRNDGDGMVKPEAFIVLKENSPQQNSLVEELRVFCKGKLAGYKYPRWINFVEELPKTVTGKIQRFKLRT